MQPYVCSSSQTTQPCFPAPLIRVLIKTIKVKTSFPENKAGTFLGSCTKTDKKKKRTEKKEKKKKQQQTKLMAVFIVNALHTIKVHKTTSHLFQIYNCIEFFFHVIEWKQAMDNSK